MTYVGPEGPRTATLAIVAEKPSHDELRLNRPLVGPIGKMLRQMCRRAGIDAGAVSGDTVGYPKDVYLTNSVKNVNIVGNPTDSDIRREQLSLFRELDALPNLNCIVALGQSSLVSLSNFSYNDITHRRGSVVQSFIRKKMVPTFHSSYIVRGNWRMQPVVEYDLARAKRESAFPDIRRRERFFNVMPESIDEALHWCKLAEEGEWLCFDLETRRRGPHMNWYMTHFGFANNILEGYSIPLIRLNGSHYWSAYNEARIMRAIQRLVSLPHKRYVTQGGLTADCWWLYRHGINTPYMSKGFDTMYAHRYLAADLPHALEFLVSIYTDEEYYKDESGKHEDDSTKITDVGYSVYNCKDSVLQLEVAFNEIADMKELGMYDYYMAEKQSQWDVLFDMRKKGFHVDKDKKQQLTTKLEAIVHKNTEELRAKLGWVPNTKSSTDMGRLLDNLGIKPTLTQKSKKAKISEERLLFYAHQVPSAQPIIVNCIEITQQRTLLGNFLRLTTDPRDFYHASYDLSKARTGRLASEGAEEGHCLPKKKKAGPQLQNIPRRLRSMFIADNPETDELTSFDFSQAEPHVVAWVSNDVFYINALLSGKDVHRIAGTVIFRGYDTRTGELPDDELIGSIPKFCDKCLAEGEIECVHSERYLSKRCKNGFAYRMGAERLMAVLRKVSLFLTKQQAEFIRSRVVNKVMVDHWNEIEKSLRKDRWLTNIYGTKREFYGRMDDKTLGEALSWEAQSAVTHITCRAMRLLHETFTKDKVPCRVVTQTHDSIVINAPKTMRHYVHTAIENYTYCPVMVHGRELNIPKEITHGPNWADQEKCRCGM